MPVAINGGGEIAGAYLRDVPAFLVSSCLPGGCPGTTVALTSGATVPLGFTVEQLDTHGWHNTANGRFTPQIAGWYQFELNVLTGAAGSYSGGLASLMKNGVEVGRGGQIGAGGANGFHQMLVSKLIYLNGTTDYVSAQFTVTATSPILWSDGAYTYFQGHLVRSGP